MLINAVIYDIPEEHGDAVERMFAELAAASRREPGCISYEVMRGGEGQRGHFALYEKWEDDAALAEHMRAEHFVRLGINGVRPLATSRVAVKGSSIA